MGSHAKFSKAMQEMSTRVDECESHMAFRRALQAMQTVRMSSQWAGIWAWVCLQSATLLLLAF